MLRRFFWSAVPRRVCVSPLYEPHGGRVIRKITRVGTSSCFVSDKTAERSWSSMNSDKNDSRFTERTGSGSSHIVVLLPSSLAEMRYGNSRLSEMPGLVRSTDRRPSGLLSESSHPGASWSRSNALRHIILVDEELTSFAILARVPTHTRWGSLFLFKLIC